MSKLASSRSSATARILLATVGLTAATAVAIVFAADHGHTPPRPPAATRPATGVDATHGAARGTSDVSPEAAARMFVSGYVSFLYGRRGGARVAPVDRALHRQLLEGQSTVTPAELARNVFVSDVAVVARTNTSATGSAIVDDGASPPYALSFNLALRHGRWIVTSAEGTGR